MYDDEKIFDVPWYKHLFFMLSPGFLYAKYLRKQKYANRKFDDIMSVFEDKRIDFLPGIESGYRGFRLILDNKTSLEFIQNGDHFEFDTYITSTHEYPKGNISILDDIKKEWD